MNNESSLDYINETVRCHRANTEVNKTKAVSEMQSALTLFSVTVSEKKNKTVH